MAQWQTFQKHLSITVAIKATHQQQPMSNTKQNRAQKRAIIAASIQERTHRAISVKMPIALADRLKLEAKENNKIFTGYVLEKIERGMEVSHD